MTTMLSVNEFWKKARELLMGLWNRKEREKVQWLERDEIWYDGVNALARSCRSDQEQRRFKWWEDNAVSLINRTRMTIWDYDIGSTKVNAEGKRHFIKSLKDMNEEGWDYSKRIQAIMRIANSWIRKGEDEEDVAIWMNECMLQDWDLNFKYEDWKYGRF